MDVDSATVLSLKYNVSVFLGVHWNDITRFDSKMAPKIYLNNSTRFDSRMNLKVNFLS